MAVGSFFVAWMRFQSEFFFSELRSASVARGGLDGLLFCWMDTLLPTWIERFVVMMLVMWIRFCVVSTCASVS